MIDLMPYKLYPYFVMDWIGGHLTSFERYNTIQHYLEWCMEENQIFSIAGLFAYIEENGFDRGMCYPSFNEFLDNEYQDQEYMKVLIEKHSLEQINNKMNKFKSLYEYLKDNEDYFYRTNLRYEIMKRFKEGKDYAQTAREIGVTRQCVHISIKNALNTIEKNKGKLGGI